MTGKWMVTMKREKDVNKAVVDARTEQSAMFAAETIHSHKGWRAVSASPAVRTTQEEVERMFLEGHAGDAEHEAFLRITA